MIRSFVGPDLGCVVHAAKASTYRSAGELSAVNGPGLRSGRGLQVEQLRVRQLRVKKLRVMVVRGDSRGVLHASAGTERGIRDPRNGGPPKGGIRCANSIAEPPCSTPPIRG